MNKAVSEKLFVLLGSTFKGNKLPKDYLSVSSQEIQSLLKISKVHDIAHLIAFAVEQNALLDKSSDSFSYLSKEMLTALFRYEKINYAYNRVCDALEDAKIAFLPLKGSVLRQYYPQPWMRTSCDIDILIHKNDLETAKEYLVNTCGYTCGTQSAHDVSFFSEDHTHIELHYDLIEYGRANAASGVLNTVWDACTVADGKSYQHLMSDEMFYFYHVAHMAKHLEEGGCGIRPFIDLWILDNIEEIDKDKRTALLEQGNLLKFAETARALSKVWIDNAAHTETTEQLENYILSGGVYGSSENRITVQQQKKGGRFRYALSKIFLPYEVIKFHYPILEKHKWLTPFMEVRRWFKLIFCGHAKRSLNELKCNNSVSSDTAESVKRFMENIGL